MIIPTVKMLRTDLGRSQREIAALLGISKKTVQSYEQGWRKMPPHVEQAVLLHTILHRSTDFQKVPFCWQVCNCPPEIRNKCPSGRLRTPGFCWLITGTLCHGLPTGSWAAKRTRCLACSVMKTLLKADA